jgi:hypothetical protein
MNITRLLVRLEAKHEWIERRGWAAMCDVEHLLINAIKDGVFDRGDPTDIGKNIFGVGVHQTRPSTPRNGFQAKQSGFVLAENPFRPETRAHAGWERSWNRPDWSDIRR